MGASLLSRSRRAAWRAVAVAALAACVDGPTGPGDRFGNLRIRPVLEEGGRPEELGLNRIHIVVRRADGRTAVDTTLSYDVASDRTYDWLIRLESATDALDVRARVLASGDSMYAGDRDVMLQEAWPGEGPVEDVSLGYVGRGADAEQIAIAPRDTVLTFGASVQYRATGTDGEGRPVTDLVVFWGTSDEEVATVTGEGHLTAPARRSKLYVIATTPHDLVDSTTVTFAPVASRVIALQGDGATARVAESLTLAVQVLADDGLGVPGVPVRFEAPEGGAVADALVTSDDDGIARTSGTLGSRPGEHVFTATAEGFPGTPLRTTARSGPPARLRFITQPGFAILNEVITPAVEIGVSDAYDNVATDPGQVVTLGFGENPGDGTLSGSIAVEAVDGVARFADLTIDALGNGYTLRASAPGLPATTSGAFDVTPRIADIHVTPPAATLQARHGTQRFMAEARGPDGAVIAGVTFTWMSSDGDVATVDATGLAMATGHGTATITARAGGKTGSAALAVDLARTVETVIVTPAAVALTARGATQQFAAEARDRDGAVVPGVPFTWTSADAEVAVVDPATGLATAKTHGTTTITATTGAKTGTATLAVDLARTVETVVVTPAAVALTTRGATQQFVAEARDRDGAVVPGVPFTWTSADAEVAVVDPATGLATAKTHGTATITAATGAKTGTASLAVDLTRTVETVVVAPGAATLTARGTTQQFVAEARDRDGAVVPGVPLTWTSSDADVAGVDPVTGLATAKTHGTATITAATGAKTGTASLAVDLVRTVETVVVTPAAVTLTTRGTTQQFTAEARDRDGTVVPGVPFTWISSDALVATVDPVTGLATATGHGTATLTATTGGKTGTVVLAVDLARAVETVVVTPAAVMLTTRGATQQFTAEARDANGNVVPGVPFTWTSADAEVAIVDPATGFATAKKHGTATITATTGDKVGTAALAVDLTRTVEAVIVAPGTLTLTARGATQQFTAEARDQAGAVVPGVPFAWTSSDAEVAGIDPATGLATAKQHGSTTVTATTGTKSGTAILSVDLVATVATVAVSPATATLTALDATQQFTAEARDANGNVVPGVPLAWTSDNATVATIDAVTGLATAAGNGTAMITAATGSKSGAATVTVAQEASTVALTPQTVTFTALGATSRLSAEARDANGHVIAGAAFAWTTSDVRVATVDAAGVVTAIGNGDVTIRSAAGGASGSAAVTVRQVVATVDVTPEAVTLDALEATVQLGAVARDANGHQVEGSVFTWVSSDPGVALVSATGRVTAAGNGDATISAALDGVTDGTAVTVSQVVTAVAVTPGAATLEALEATVQLVAEARDANGHLVLHATFVWASTDDGVATVGQSGLVTAVDNGDAGVTATADGVSARSAISVSQVVTGVRVTPAEVRLVGLGGTAQLTAEARDARGHLVDGQAFFWISSNLGAATVDQTGLVAAVDDGEASVSAIASGVTGSARVIVQIPIEIVIDVKPGSDGNPINLDSGGVTPVAILTTSTFDASDVDPATVRFAGAGAVHWALEDVDGDGDTDMILHFPTQELDLKAGDARAELTGRTVTGEPFVGRDKVRAF